MSDSIFTNCPICGADLEGFSTCREAYNELSYYTLQHRDPAFFIHQYIVDAYAAQHAEENPKPITNAFALIGLYLFAEKNFSGKAVQNMHVLLAKRKKDWPIFTPPKESTAITVRNVLNAPPGARRDTMIKTWAKAVWETWKKDHVQVQKLLKPYL